MSLFLVIYDRDRQRLVNVEKMPVDDDYDAAKEQLWKAEVEHPDMEVVLLEAADLEQLRRTHGRYFEQLPPLVAAS